MGKVTLLSVAALILTLWCACAAGTAAASDHRHEVAAELLRLWPDLPRTRVEVPISVVREFVKSGLAGPERARPPVAHIIENQTHNLTINGDAAQLDVTLRLTVLDIVPPGRIALLPRDVAFREMRIDGEPHKPTPLGRWLWWEPPKPGTYTITARAALEPERDGPARAVSYSRSPSARAEVAAASGEAWVVASPDAAGRITGAAGGTKGSLALRPGPNVSVSWRRPLETAEHEPILSSTCEAACDFAPAAVAVNARLEVLVRRGTAERLVLDLPEGADRVSVTGADVRRVDGRGNTRTIHLRGAIQGRTRLAVGFELPRRSASGKAGLDCFGIRGALLTGGHLIVSNSTGGELLEDEAVRLEEEALFNLPDEVLALSSERPALAYAIQRGRWRLGCDIVLASEVRMPPTIVDRAAHTIVRRADGNIIGRASLEVRNRDRQFIRVRMPRGAKVLAALVDDKSVAITKGAAGEFILPLKKSIPTVGGLVSFPVEIIYTQ
ncbi:MAG: hypothetical protein ABIF82_12450, partial [Planctomycetota bacterium]